MMHKTLHEIENGEGNGVIHWYCSDACRDKETTDYGEVDPLEDDAPEGSICETCSMFLDEESRIMFGEYL